MAKQQRAGQVAAREVPGLVVTATATRWDAYSRAVEPHVLGRLAASALRAEAVLTPKPGLVDQRGSGVHGDMDLAMFLRSAAVLRPWFSTLAQAAASSPGISGAGTDRGDRGRAKPGIRMP
jgi:hypothetical protein